MERKEIEVYSELSNYSIVRMPGRSFPGCVIQGDSLSILLHSAQELSRKAAETGNEELSDLAVEMADDLADRLDHYEKVLKEHGFEIPYRR